VSDICELNRKIESGDSLSGPLISAPSNRGMHGFTPDHDEMPAWFFLIGPGVPPGRSLGEIDMRQIAPTLAEVMHVEKGHGVERSQLKQSR
jgi:hypothetical protein